MEMMEGRKKIGAEGGGKGKEDILSKDFEGKKIHYITLVSCVTLMTLLQLIYCVCLCLNGIDRKTQRIRDLEIFSERKIKIMFLLTFRCLFVVVKEFDLML